VCVLAYQSTPLHNEMMYVYSNISQANFVSPVQVRKIWVLGGGDANKEQHPSELKLYVNKEGIDFTGINDHTPTQVFHIPADSDGLELTTLVHAFSNVTTLHFFFSQNHGADSTAIQYIGMQGMYECVDEVKLVASYMAHTVYPYCTFCA
jgi:hypothetical protein